MEPTQLQHKRFKTTQDWHDFIGPLLQSGKLDGKTLLELRKSCYTEIETLRGRALLVYATKFVDGAPPGAPNQIDLPDVDGFTELVNSVNDKCMPTARLSRNIP